MEEKKNAEIMLSWKIKDVHHQIGHSVQALLAKQGLHIGHPRILFLINSQVGASQKELAERLQVTPASLAVSLKRLERAGFIERSSTEADQRVNKIWLSEHGRQVVDNCHRQMKKVNERIMAGFSPEEKAQLFSFLERLLDNLDDIISSTATEPRTVSGKARPADKPSP